MTNNTTFAYSVEGETVAGTVADYAHDYENAHYCGIDISRKGILLNPAGDVLEVPITKESHQESGDWFVVTITAALPNGPEVATVRIDGRA